MSDNAGVDMFHVCKMYCVVDNFSGILLVGELKLVQVWVNLWGDIMYTNIEDNCHFLLKYIWVALTGKMGAYHPSYLVTS